MLSSTNKPLLTRLHPWDCVQFVQFVVDQAPLTEQVAQLAQEIYNGDVFQELINHLHRLDFEVTVISFHY